MRLFELILIAVLLIRALLTVTTYQQTKGLRTLVTFAAVAVCVAHIFLEGLRWQMVPLYIAVFSALTVDLTRLPTPLEDLEGGRSVRRALLGVVSIVALSAVPFLFPVPKLPAPTGEALVGTFSFELTDRNRAELYADEDLDRRVIVRAWYPAASKTRAASWLDSTPEMISAMAKSGGLPRFMMSHMGLVKSHAFEAAPVLAAPDAYPLVLFEHGLQGYRSQNTFLVEDLASQGYVVLAIEHPYGALQTVFEDGTMAAYHADVLPPADDPTYKAATEQLVNQWAEDIDFVLASFTTTAQESVRDLAKQVDASKVALVGHSTGGASSLVFCLQDARCEAAVLLDPWMKPVPENLLSTTKMQNVLTMFSDLDVGYFDEDNQNAYQVFADNQTDNLKTLFVAETGHHDFDDTALLSPIARYFGHSKGALPAQRALELIRIYTKAQLGKFLLGEEVELLSANTSPYPEIEIVQTTEDLPAEVEIEEVPESEETPEPEASPELEETPVPSEDATELEQNESLEAPEAPASN